LKEFPMRACISSRGRRSAKYSPPRPQHKEKVKAVNDLKVLEGDDVLFLNGRWIVDKSLISEGEEVVVTHGDAVVYAYLKKTTVKKALENSNSIEKLLSWARKEVGEKEVDAAGLINYPWDLVNQNPEEIKKEFKEFKRLGGVSPKGFRDLEIVGSEEDVFIAKGAKIYPNVVFDTGGGPVIVVRGHSIPLQRCIWSKLNRER